MGTATVAPRLDEANQPVPPIALSKTKSPTSPPDITAVSLVDTSTDDSKRFEDASFATAITLTEGVPVSTKSIGYKVAGTLYVQAETSEIVGEDKTTTIYSDPSNINVIAAGNSGVSGVPSNIFDGIDSHYRATHFSVTLPSIPYDSSLGGVMVQTMAGVNSGFTAYLVRVNNGDWYRLGEKGPDPSWNNVNFGTDFPWAIQISQNVFKLTPPNETGTLDVIEFMHNLITDAGHDSSNGLVSGTPTANLTNRFGVKGIIVNQELLLDGESTVKLTLADNKDLDKFEAGDLVQQDSANALASDVIIGETTGFYAGQVEASPTLYPDGAYWEDVAYGNGIYFMVAYGTNSEKQPEYATSRDGLNWTTGDTTQIDMEYPGFKSIDYGKDIFVVGEQGAVHYFDNNGNYISKSKLNYTEEITIYKTSYNKDLDIYVSQCTRPGNVAIAYYSDTDDSEGLPVWQVANIPAGTLRQNGGMAYGDNRFVSCGAINNSTDATSLTSTNGKNWTALSGNFYNIKGVCYNIDRFIAVDLNGTVIQLLDGATAWTVVSTQSHGFRSLSADGYGTIIAGDLGTLYYSEDNGLTWTEMSVPSSVYAGYSNALIYNNGTLVAGVLSSAATTKSLNIRAFVGDAATLTLSGVKDLAKFELGSTVSQDDNAATGNLVDIDLDTPSVTVIGNTAGWSANTNNFIVGTADAGKGEFVSTTGVTMTLTPISGAWSANTGNYAVGPRKVEDEATLYLKTNSSREVTGVSNAPVYYDTLETTDEITFNLAPGTGNTWDQEFPDGTTIQACVYADNTTFGGGRSPETGTIDSNLLQPGSTTVRNLTQAEVNATKLLFETTEHRRCKHMCDVTARAAEIRAQFEAQGYTTQQINTLLNESVTPEPETPVAISGYYPLYTSEAEANSAGNGTSHTHLFNDITYYMPNGVTFYHGNYDGY